MEGDSIYNLYSRFLVQRYGTKVYKLPVNLPGTCPNRDGKISVGGCIFCDEQGAGFQCLPNTTTVMEQIEKNRVFFAKRFKAHKFIVYFQAFTNTYMLLEVFKQNIYQSCRPDVVGIAISTRPDCINEAMLDFLSEIKTQRGIDIYIELGLQTVNYHTLARINRGHSLAEFIDAALRIQRHGFETCAHIILNLPWDNALDVQENAKILSALGVKFVKLHSLYVVANTVLGEMYKNGQFEMRSLEQYVDSVIMFLEHLDPDVVVQRLVGKGPADNLLFSNWGASWWKIKQMIEGKMLESGSYQGKRFNYLNGSGCLT